MCGVVGVLVDGSAGELARRGVEALRHRGPDGQAVWTDASGSLALGHARLKIIDLSDAGAQPMASSDGRYVIAFNGEVYNYLELRRELDEYPFRSRTDTEVVLAAWTRWGPAALSRFVGMFAFVLWDNVERRVVVVRDRFGVKPLYMAPLPGGGVAIASEIKSIHAMGLPAVPDDVQWASFLAHGVTDDGSRTFWQGISAVPAGSMISIDAVGRQTMTRWYDLAYAVGADVDSRELGIVRDEYRSLLEDAIRLRFRSDVPVGINLSGGLDSSLLLGLVHAVQGADSDVSVFSFGTGDPAYDELPWVEAMLARTRHPLVQCVLMPAEVPELALKVTRSEDEPFGGLPTLAYAKVFETARRHGVIVLLDGQGMDEQWAGYDYYRSALGAERVPTVQGAKDSATRAECLAPEFAAGARQAMTPAAFTDRLRNLQLRDALYTKLPRALRYNDRISMAASTELREPFLDHRLFELAMRQPPERKIFGETTKWLLREIASELLPDKLRLAPKRPVQTPQREWLRGPLSDWAESLIETALARYAGWFDVRASREEWHAYRSGRGDNSYWVWQWLSLGLLG